LLYQAQYSWIKGIVKIRNILVHSIHRNGILAEIIGSNTEKVNFFGNNIRRDRR
jgi:hypothetical protein